MSSNNFYQPVWEKFLPVIIIKLKKAIKGRSVESLKLDKLDFEKLSNRKNASFLFSIELIQGRVVRSKTNTPISLDFARALKENPTSAELINSATVRFTLDRNFLLTIAPVHKAEAVEQAQPAATQPAEAQPAETQSAEAPPIEAQSAEAQSAEAQSAEAKPIAGEEA